MKKIGLLCLCLACLSLAGCFHIPDEDWLPSKNKINTGDTHTDEEMEQALNSFMDGINIISSEWDVMKGEGNDEISIEDGEENAIEGEEMINDGEIDNSIENEETENDELVEDEVVEDGSISEE